MWARCSEAGSDGIEPSEYQIGEITLMHVERVGASAGVEPRLS